MAANISNLDIGLVVGFFGGIVAFFRGFRTYRESRLLQDTPGMPIRSIAMGFVRVHGKAQSDQLVDSPITHTPCCFYTVEIEKWEKREDSGIWSHYGAEANGVWFYLEDASGRVMVDPHGAEYELEMTGRREVASATASSFAADGISDRDLLAYVARMGMTPKIPGLHHPLGMAGAGAALSQYMNHQISPNEFFQGMVGSQMAQMEAQTRQRLEAEGPLSDPRREEVRLTMIELNKLPFWDPKYDELRRLIVKMQARNRKLGLFGTVAPAQPSPPSTDVAVPVANPPAADPPFPSDQPLASGQYRLTECCILPDHDYDISGTCAENPGAKDLSDRNLIRKGKDEPTYLISGLTRPGVNVVMQLRVQLMIFGGGILSVVCLTLLLLRFGVL